MIPLMLSPDFQPQLLTYNWAPDLGAALGRALVRPCSGRTHAPTSSSSPQPEAGLPFHHYGQLDFPVRDEKVPAVWAPPLLEQVS